MVRKDLEKILVKTVVELENSGFLPLGAAKAIASRNHLIEFCPDALHGDYASSAAMQLAGLAKKNPLEIADKIKIEIEKKHSSQKIIKKIETAAPGFINFFISNTYWQKETNNILKQKNKFGSVNIGRKIKAQVEFISANPSGQLHVGNGRSAFWGDALANVLSAAGWAIEREYYINDARVSKQIQILGATALGHGDAYLSPYLQDLIKKLQPCLSKIKSESDAGYFLSQQVVRDLKKFIGKKLKIKFDNWISEENIYKSGLVLKTYEMLKAKGLVFEKDGAYWLDLSKFNQKNEVLLRANGMPTYFLSDIAYHLDKIQRGYKKIIDIWGADHQGHIPRMKAAMKILGYGGEFDILICQIVTIKGGKISKREGNIIPLNWLIDEVGLDAARFFYLQKSLSSQMEFDVELAKKKSQDSPVYYAQYAYARIASILRRAKAKKITADNANLKLLEHPAEIALIKELVRLPEIIEDTAKDYQVQRLCQYVLEGARAFHCFWRDCCVISEDKKITQARLSLVVAAQTVFKKTFDLLGISAPEKM